MLAYVSTQYHRAAALAYLSSLGPGAILTEAYGETEHRFSIQTNVGDLLPAVEGDTRPDEAAEFFASIRQGADLSRVPAKFRHWFLATQVPLPPDDFLGLREF